MKQRNKVLLDKRVVVHVQDNALKDYCLHENLYKCQAPERTAYSSGRCTCQNATERGFSGRLTLAILKE